MYNKGNDTYHNERELIYELQQEIDKLTNDNKNKENFILNITHDMRSHLNVIISIIQLMEYRKLSENDDKKYKNMIKRNGYKILKLINNLIDMSKLENNYYKLEKVNVDIVSIVENTMECIEKYALEKNIQLIFDTNKEECIAAIDPQAIDRILMNLLSNAIKFSPNDSEILVYLNINDENIQISVKDKGNGISEEEKDKIFNRFYQCESRSNKELIGSGIGLDLTNYLVKAHSGSIEIDSKEKEGSKFIVNIPRVLEKGLVSNKIKYNTDKIQMLEIEFSDIYLS